MNYGRALATTAASTTPLNKEIFFYSAAAWVALLAAVGAAL